MGRNVTSIAVCAATFGFGACAALDHLSTGRADTLDQPPFLMQYAAVAAVGHPGQVLIMPIGLDDSRNREDWPPGREAAFEPLLEQMNEYLRDRRCCPVAAPGVLDLAGGPYLYLGSAESDGTPAPAAVERPFGAEYPAMVLYVEKPSDAWRAELGRHLAASGTSYALRLSIGVAEYPKADRGAFGKQVHLGTGYSRPIEFLSAIDKPVEVVQITGLLVDSQGNILRAGGEGFFASDTLFRYQIFDLTRTIDHAQIARLVAEERRADLPGAPLAWEVALRNLVERLLNAPLT